MGVCKLANFVALMFPNDWSLECSYFWAVWYYLRKGPQANKMGCFSKNVEFYCNVLMLMDTEPLKVDIIQGFI